MLLGLVLTVVKGEFIEKERILLSVESLWLEHLNTVPIQIAILKFFIFFALKERSSDYCNNVHLQIAPN